MPKFPVRVEINTGKIEDRGADTDITIEDIEALKSFAQDSYPLSDPEKEAVYGAVAQSFSDGENFQIMEKDIVGMSSDSLEGNFKIFIGKKGELNKIDSLMNRVNLPAIRKYFTADSTAKAVLSASEMENGVALIDFGGGCTSVSIYHGGIMRYYASIPFGGKNITDDIKSECQIGEKLAENIKLAFGACMPEKLQNLSEKIIVIQGDGIEKDKQLLVKYLSEIITARVEEIMMAVLYEIEQSGFADMLRSGIVITGGSAQIPNLGNFINDISGYRTRTGYPKHLFSFNGCDDILSTSASTSLGLILAAKNEPCLNCADTSPVRETKVETQVEQYRETIFDEDEIETVKPVKTPVKEKAKTTSKIKWTDKMGVFFGSLYESVNENIENEEV